MKKIENVLNSKDWQKLNTLLNSQSFPWYYMTTTAYDHEKPTPWGFSFFHMFQIVRVSILSRNLSGNFPINLRIVASFPNR